MLKGEAKGAQKGGEPAIVQIIMATHAGMTTEEFETLVRDWTGSAKHPKTGRLYTEMIYQPMLELLAYLRANGFKTYIVSGGGIEFMRPWTEKVFGIPPEQVVGSSIKIKFDLRDGKPVLVRLPAINFIDDKAGKPVGIHQHIGRRPIGPAAARRQHMATHSRRLGIVILLTLAATAWVPAGPASEASAPEH